MTPQAQAPTPRSSVLAAAACDNHRPLALETYQVDEQKGRYRRYKDVLQRHEGLVSSVGDARFEPKAREENIEWRANTVGSVLLLRVWAIVIAPMKYPQTGHLKPLDEIVKVDEKNVIGMTSDEVVKLLRGPAGKPVKIGVRRKNVDKLLEFNIVREIIKIKTVRLEMLGGKIAYIKINQFNLKTDIELESILNYAKKEKATGISIRTIPEAYSTYVLTSLPGLSTAEWWSA